MKTIARILGAAILAAAPAFAADNAQLKQLFEADQADRASDKNVDWARLELRDRERQRTALALIQAGAVLTADDYYHAAMVFQHADNAEDNALAYALAVMAFRINPAHAKARWLAAAAWDRTLMRKNKPQWYGTQFVRDRKTGKWILYEIDEGAVTEEERMRYVGRPLSKAPEVLKQLNAAE